MVHIRYVVFYMFVILSTDHRNIIVLSGERHPLQYPSKTVVPASVTNDELTEVANFHR